VERVLRVYAGLRSQGLRTDEGSKFGGKFASSCNAPLSFDGLAEVCTVAVRAEGLEPSEKYAAFLAVLDRDARDSLAAMSWFWPNRYQFAVD